MVAIGARKLSDAKKFAKLHKIPKFYEGYASLLQDPDVGNYLDSIKMSRKFL